VRGGRSGAATRAFSVALALAGLSCLLVAAGDQQHAPQPPLTEAVPAQSAPPAPPTAFATPANAATPATAAHPVPPHALADRSGPASLAAPHRAVPPSAAAATTGPSVPTSVPLALQIPAIGVRSPLLQLGQAADGTLAVPPPGAHYDEAGWYRYSPTPGSPGPAVIAGHVDSAVAGPSVFFRLGGLHARDLVRVARADGLVAVFVVDEVRRYHKTAFPTALVYGNTPGPTLRLITCGGSFDHSTGHYTDNIVVLASLARVEGMRRPPVAAP